MAPDGPRPLSPEALPSPGPGPIVTLEEGECLAVLARQRLCVMAVVDAGEPYAVPIFFGFDGSTVYLGLAEGRKTRALDTHPGVCVVVTEVGPGDAWCSVMVAGRATALTDQVERDRAIEVLMAHNRRLSAVAGKGIAPAGARRTTGGRVLRVDDAVITGRARRAEPGSSTAARLPHHDPRQIFG